MSATAAAVTVGGRPYSIVGANKATVTDVTVSTNSESVTAAQLGLNAIYSARAEILTGQSTDTAVYANCTIATGAGSITLAGFTAAGVAATTAASTVYRVYASGY